jgi:hypothetical protein
VRHKGRLAVIQGRQGFEDLLAVGLGIYAGPDFGDLALRVDQEGVALGHFDGHQIHERAIFGGDLFVGVG